jgi:hypothetical protein
MKRFVVTTILLLLCSAFPASLMAREKPSVDITKMDHIYLGWVDLDPNEFYALGYTKAEWAEVIANENEIFQQTCTKLLPGRTITPAKSKEDEIAAGNDLYVKFSDAEFTRHYRLHISVHFIDLKTNAEIASIPLRSHTGHLCGLVSCLQKELDEVSKELQAQIAPEGKK